MNSRFQSFSLLLVFLASFFSSFPTSASARSSYCGNFLDVYEDQPLCEAAYYVRDQGIFEGYSTGNFMPDANINRAEIIKVALVSFLDEDFDTYNPPLGSDLNFNDIPATQNQWWQVYLKRAQELGAVSGYADGSFRAGNMVTRAEFLKMFVYLSPYKEKVEQWTPSQGGVTSWIDVPQTAWYYNLMAFADQNGLLEDLDYCGSNRICPDQAITRGEVAQVIYNYSQAFDSDLGFPHQGLLTRIYSMVTGYSSFMVDEVPDEFDFAFKVPARVFNSNEVYWGLKNVDCSEAPDSYSEAQTHDHYDLEEPWISFYTDNSNWEDEGEESTFFFNDEYGYFHGEFEDRLGDLREDIEDSRCIKGTFGDQNYED